MTWIRSHIVLIIAALSMGAIGCDEHVAAPMGVDEPFSIYGVLNPRSDRQTMLVSPLQPLLSDYGETIDAEVTSTDLSTGQQHVWRDSTVRSETGQIDHVFWSAFRPSHDSEYRIDVVRSDGASSSAIVQVPMDAGYQQIDNANRLLNVRIVGDGFRLLDAELVYIVGKHPFHPDHPVIRLPISFAGKEARTDNGYEFRFDLGIDYFELASRYVNETGYGWLLRFPITNGLAFEGLELRITVGSESWDPPGGSFDAAVLVHPRTMTNVDNGFGYVGGGYDKTITLCPSEATLDDTWFFDYLEREECTTARGGDE